MGRYIGAAVCFVISFVMFILMMEVQFGTTLSEYNEAESMWWGWFSLAILFGGVGAWLIYLEGTVRQHNASLSREARRRRREAHRSRCNNAQRS